MRRVFAGPVILALSWSLLSAEVGGQDGPATPAEQYKALVKESQSRYDAAQKEAFKSVPKGGVLPDDERTALVGLAYRSKYEQAPKLVGLAERYPRDPVALDALTEAVWQVNTTPYPVEMVGRDPARPKAFELLRRDHIGSEKLGPLCERISYGFGAEYEPFLRDVLEKNPHKEVRAQACLALAHFLGNRSLKLDLVLGDPKQAREFADLYGEEYLERLRRQDRVKAAEEAEALLVRAMRDYGGDVKLPDGETVAEKAEPELFGLRHLAVGKTAPDIEGQDQDGVRFKLSDYRGKVVLIDFWSEV
ncbi:peroxiredoxin family protein [Paludisphaera soli]|uniref:peroxiredoxin family protein n=1 Tax=Paludisphaera soli TaxID=2712865 RepID=UPI00197D8195|nr:redoxin domain-containing protein [Paludisphaera soli]